MFSALKLGSLVYLLYKGETPKLKIGTVLSVSSPQFLLYSLGDSTVNITVKTDELLEFKNLPSSLSIVMYQGVLISESRLAMCDEVEAMVRNSKLIIDSILYHKGVVESGEEMLKTLNPSYAKQKELSDKINNLETKVGNMENKLDSIAEMLNRALTK